MLHVLVPRLVTQAVINPGLELTSAPGQVLCTHRAHPLLSSASVSSKTTIAKSDCIYLLVE